MELTRENYHSKEANQAYMSNSQYKEFMNCESMALAKIRGTFISPSNDSFLIGSYVHAWSEGRLDEFIQNTPALFKSNGELYAKYEYADRMIYTLKNDKLITFLLQGQKEVILTADMFGTTWKIMLDSYEPKKKFVDLKTTADIHKKVWHPYYGFTSFVEAYEYIRQFAIYSEIERLASGSGDWIESFLIAVSKEEDPDKEVISIDEERMRIELAEVEANMPRILAVKAGLEEPKRCEKCKHCRQTKRLTGAIHYTELIS